MNTILYLHGFRSSSRSKKAALIQRYMRSRGLGDRLTVPDLHYRPTQAISQLQWLLLGKPPGSVTLVGSSLGGFYATVLAEKLGMRAVLINPPVHPHTHLARYTGPQQVFWSDQAFEFTMAHVQELEALDVTSIQHPERFWLAVETADDTCDYRLSTALYAGARHTVFAGGAHEMTHFAELLPAIVRFAGLTP